MYMRRFLTTVLLTLTLSAAAQTDRDVLSNHKVLTFGAYDSLPPTPKDSIRRIIEMFYVDQFRHFDDPQAPYFLFMSRDATLAMGVGGAVRMRGYYDW